MNCLQAYYNITLFLVNSCCIKLGNIDIAGIQPPSQVRFTETFVEGMMHVQWDNHPCESSTPAPYILNYIVVICTLQSESQNKCKGK